jgi:hypothetical protein
VALGDAALSLLGFTGTNVQILTQLRQQTSHFSWLSEMLLLDRLKVHSFTCFTGTKVQMLTPEARAAVL